MSRPPFHVAIIGGGLCGISLGIALKERSIPFTLYEARSSFTEIGAGINFGPSALRALREIHPDLGARVSALATRMPPPDEEVWMQMRYGAASGTHEDGELVMKVLAPPTGSLTLHRQELLQELAGVMGTEHARFEKKLVGLVEAEDEVVLEFADGTRERSSVVVGCDGVHSRVRMWLCGEDSPAAKPQFHNTVAYRAVLPVEEAASVVGEWIKRPTLHLGPDGYIISYPVSGGTKVNCGVWVRRDRWPHDAWILPNQNQQLESAVTRWGDRAHKLLSLYPADTAAWATFQHIAQPESFVRGRVILIGDGAHAMVPHQGAGASQAAEDAHVLAVVLADVLHQSGGTREAVEKGLLAVEAIRKPRFQKVHRFSSEARDRFFDFWGARLEGDDLAEWKRETDERLQWIMGVDVAAEAENARQRYAELMSNA